MFSDQISPFLKTANTPTTQSACELGLRQFHLMVRAKLRVSEVVALQLDDISITERQGQIMVQACL